MNGTYEIQYDWAHGGHEVETVTVDGRSQRNNRLPLTLVEYAKKRAGIYGAKRIRISAIRLTHIRPSGITHCHAKLVWECEDVNNVGV